MKKEKEVKDYSKIINMFSEEGEDLRTDFITKEDYNLKIKLSAFPGSGDYVALKRVLKRKYDEAVTPILIYAIQNRVANHDVYEKVKTGKRKLAGHLISPGMVISDASLDEILFYGNAALCNGWARKFHTDYEEMATNSAFFVKKEDYGVFANRRRNRALKEFMQFYEEKKHFYELFYLEIAIKKEQYEKNLKAK